MTAISPLATRNAVIVVGVNIDLITAKWPNGKGEIVVAFYLSFSRPTYPYRCASSWHW